jgi:DNA-binding transcriptional ArsR family regulator
MRPPAVIAWAHAQKGLKPATRIVLWTLAYYANGNEEAKCWPSRARLARDTELSVDTIDRHLEVLEQAGLITIEKRTKPDGSPATSMITLNLDVEMLDKHLQRNRKSLSYAQATQPQVAATPEAPTEPQLAAGVAAPVPPPVAASCGPNVHSSNKTDETTHPYPPTGRAKIFSRTISNATLAAACQAIAGMTTPADDAAAAHDAIEIALRGCRFQTTREVKVADRGDGRPGRIDLVAGRDNTMIAIEIDRESVRPKSLHKLSQVDAFKLVVLRRSSLSTVPDGVDAIVVLDPVAATKGPATAVFIRKGSAQWHRWVAHLALSGKKPYAQWYASEGAEGCYQRSEWPPGRDDAAPSVAPATHRAENRHDETPGLPGLE